jgi:cell division protein FtsL
MGKAHLIRAAQIGAGVLIVVLCIGLYRAKSDAARTEAHVEQLQAEIADSEAALRELRAEIAHLESPARVEALAEQHLGVTVGGEAEALPEAAINARLPAPRPAKGRE